MRTIAALLIAAALEPGAAPAAEPPPGCRGDVNRAELQAIRASATSLLEACRGGRLQEAVRFFSADRGEARPMDWADEKHRREVEGTCAWLGSATQGGFEVLSVRYDDGQALGVVRIAATDAEGRKHQQIYAFAKHGAGHLLVDVDGVEAAQKPPREIPAAPASPGPEAVEVRRQIEALFAACCAREHADVARLLVDGGTGQPLDPALPEHLKEGERVCRAVAQRFQEATGYQFGNTETQGDVVGWEVWYTGDEPSGQVWAFKPIEGRWRLVDIDRIR